MAYDLGLKDGLAHLLDAIAAGRATDSLAAHHVCLSRLCHADADARHGSAAASLALS